MTLDDVYGSEFDRFPLEQEAADWSENEPALIWDEPEVVRFIPGLAFDRLTLH